MIRFAWKLDSEASEPWKSLTRAEASLNVFLLGCLILEPILIIVLESFTAHYDMLRLSYCTLDLVVLGFAQTDFMYHGLLIVASIYQLFLYLNVLRQRNICHLLALILFGRYFFSYRPRLILPFPFQQDSSLSSCLLFMSCNTFCLKRRDALNPMTVQTQTVQI